MFIVVIGQQSMHEFCANFWGALFSRILFTYYERFSGKCLKLQIKYRYITKIVKIHFFMQYIFFFFFIHLLNIHNKLTWDTYMSVHVYLVDLIK